MWMDGICSVLHDRSPAAQAVVAPESTAPTLASLKVLKPPARALKGANRLYFEELAKVRNKIYEAPLEGFENYIRQLSQNRARKLSHAEAKKLLKLAGVPNVDAAHVGGVIDTVLMEVPRQIFKLPFRMLAPVVLPTDGASVLQDGVMRASRAPVGGTGRIIVGGITAPLRNHGFFARGLPLDSTEMQKNAQSIAQFKHRLEDLKALANRAGKPLGPDGARPPDLSALKHRIADELAFALSKDADLKDAFNLDARMCTQLVMVAANMAVQIITSSGASIALGAVGLAPLARLTSLITYPVMAGLTKAASNWHDTKAIGLLALQKYNALENRSELTSISHWLQDQFQNSHEAAFSRHIENLLIPALQQDGMELAKKSYRIDELTALMACGTDRELAQMKSILSVQREINALNLNCPPDEPLIVDREIMNSVLTFAKMDSKDLSDQDLEFIIFRNSEALLSVQSSSAHDDSKLWSEFKNACAERTRVDVSATRIANEYKKCVARGNEKVCALAPTPISGFTYIATVKGSDAYRAMSQQADRLELRFKTLEQRAIKQKKIEELSTLFRKSRLDGKAAVSGATTSDFQNKQYKLLEEKTTLEIDYANAKIDYERYAKDIEHLKAGDVGQIDAGGKLVRQVLTKDRGIGRAMLHFLKNDIPYAFQSGLTKQIALPTAEVAGFQLAQGAVSGSLRPSLNGMPKFEDEDPHAFSRPANPIPATIVSLSAKRFNNPSSSTSDPCNFFADMQDGSARLTLAEFEGRFKSAPLRQKDEPLSHEVTLHFAQAIKWMRPEDMFSGVQALLPSVEKLPQYQAIEVLQTQLRHVATMPDADAIKMVNSVYTASLKFDDQHRAEICISILKELKELSEPDRASTFQKLSLLTLALDGPDQALVQEHLISAIGLLGRSKRLWAFDMMLERTQGLPAKARGPWTDALTSQIRYLSSKSQLKSYQSILDSVIVKGVPTSPDPSLRVDSVLARPDGASYFDNVIGQIRRLKPAVRKSAFDASLAVIRKLPANDRRQPMAALTLAINYLRGDMQAAHHAVMKSFEGRPRNELSEYLVANMRYMPSQFRKAMFYKVFDMAGAKWATSVDPILALSMNLNCLPDSSIVDVIGKLLPAITGYAQEGLQHSVLQKMYVLVLSRIALIKKPGVIQNFHAPLLSIHNEAATLKNTHMERLKDLAFRSRYRSVFGTRDFVTTQFDITYGGFPFDTPESGPKQKSPDKYSDDFPGSAADRTNPLADQKNYSLNKVDLSEISEIGEAGGASSCSADENPEEKSKSQGVADVKEIGNDVVEESVKDEEIVEVELLENLEILADDAGLAVSDVLPIASVVTGGAAGAAVVSIAVLPDGSSPAPAPAPAPAPSNSGRPNSGSANPGSSNPGSSASDGEELVHSESGAGGSITGGSGTVAGADVIAKGGGSAGGAILVVVGPVLVVGGTVAGAGLAADKLKTDLKTNESEISKSEVHPSDVHGADITNLDDGPEKPKTSEPKLDRVLVDVTAEFPMHPQPRGDVYGNRINGKDDVKVVKLPKKPLPLKRKVLDKEKFLRQLKVLNYGEKLSVLKFIRQHGKFPEKYYKHVEVPTGTRTGPPDRFAKPPKPMASGSAPNPTGSACGVTVFDTAANTLRNAASGFLGKVASAIGSSDVPLDPEALYVTRNPARGAMLKDNPPLKILRPTPKQMPADSMGVRIIDPQNIPSYIARADSRPMEEILKNGFEPRGTNASMRSHLSGGSSDSAYVSFSRSAAQAERYAFGPSSQENLPRFGYNYILKVPDVDVAVSSPYVNWYDVEEKLAQSAGSANREFAIKGKVPASWIVRIDKFERVMNRDSTWRVKHLETYDVNTFDRYWGDLADDDIL